MLSLLPAFVWLPLAVASQVKPSGSVPLSVTSPASSAVPSYVLLAVGAVNTVRVRREEGRLRLTGYNTDVEGFRRSLAGHPLPHRALVLGTGGAAAAVTYVLRQWGVEYKMVSRRPTGGQIGYEATTPAMIGEWLWLIHCTPVGMYPDVETCPPVPYEALTGNNFLYDLVYNPEETLFLRRGRERGALTQNGLKMLHLQADAAWEIWNLSRK